MTRLEGLTQLRTAAAWWVALYHIREWFDALNLDLLDQILSYGYLGVDFFFILSGVVIKTSLDARRNSMPRSGTGFQDFVSRRFWRIYPVHLFVLVSMISFPVGLMFFSRSQVASDFYSPLYFFASVTLVQGWLPVPLKWNSPAWSVSCEMLVYVLFGAFYFRWKGAGLLNRLSARSAFLLAGAFLLSFALILSWSGVRTLGGMLAGYGVIRCAVEFSIGVLLQIAYTKSRVSVWIPVAGLAVGFWLLAVGKADYFWATLVFSSVLLLFGSRRLELPGQLGAFLTTLGNWSYSTYIVHYPVKLALHMLDLDKLLQAGVLVTVYILLVLVASGLLYTFVESPLSSRSGGRSLFLKKSASSLQ